MMALVGGRMKRPDAKALLGGDLGQALAPHAEARKAAIKRFKVLGIAGIAAGVIVWQVLAWTGNEAAGGLGFMAFFALLVIAIVQTIKVGKQVSTALNDAFGEAIGLEHRKEADPRLYERAEQMHLLAEHTMEVFGEEWHGELYGRRFRLHALELKKSRGTSSSSTPRPVFTGFAMAIASKPSPSIFVIERKLADQDYADWPAPVVDGKTLVQLDSIDGCLEKDFIVWLDEPATRHLLTARFRRRLTEYIAAHPTDDIKTILSNGDLWFVIDRGHLFPIVSLGENDDATYIEQTGEIVCGFGEFASEMEEALWADEADA